MGTRLRSNARMNDNAGTGRAGARSVTDKIVAIVFPVTAFAALGFEHSIANWFFLPFGLMLDRTGAMSIYDIARNLVAVTAGNIAGGTLLVAGVHWLAYLLGGPSYGCRADRGQQQPGDASAQALHP